MTARLFEFLFGALALISAISMVARAVYATVLKSQSLSFRVQDFGAFCFFVGLVVCVAYMGWSWIRQAVAFLPGKTRLREGLEIYLRLSNSESGNRSERESIFALESNLAAIAESRGLGELDGNEFGSGEAVLYFNTPDGRALFEALHPILKAEAQERGVKVILHHSNEQRNELKMR